MGTPVSRGITAEGDVLARLRSDPTLAGALCSSSTPPSAAQHKAQDGGPWCPASEVKSTRLSTDRCHPRAPSGAARTIAFF